MLRPLPRTALYAACLGLTLVTGCTSLLAPKVPPTRYYVLSATPGATEASSAAASELEIGLGPVGVPGYLDRRELVTRAAPNRLEVAALDLWAEPIGQNVKSVLAEDLAARLGGATVVVFPWNVGYRPDYRVRIDVTRFEATSDGTAVLEARWSLRDDARKRTVAHRESRASEPLSDGSAESAVAALSATLGTLADEIAHEVARQAATR